MKDTTNLRNLMIKTMKDYVLFMKGAPVMEVKEVEITSVVETIVDDGLKQMQEWVDKYIFED